MKPIFFKTGNDFRKWLEKNHKTRTELLVGYYKVDSGKPGMTWSQSVDEAICFGWIDGIRRSIDKESYCIRFTPRRPTSVWSKVNIRKVEELTRQGLMHKAGIEAFNKRRKSKSGIYSFENEETALSQDYENTFRKNKSAWDFYSQQAPSYRKNIVRWIMDAKQEKTQIARLEKAIKASEERKRIY